MKSYRILFLVLMVLAQHLFGQGKPLRVVTTLNYLKYVTQQIGGEKVSVTALANPRQDPHYVTPTPRMNQIANDADLFIENGLNLDLWAKNVLDASGNPKIQPGNAGHLVASLNVPVRELPTEVSRAWGDIHPQGNPHIWLDPLNIKIIAENIAGRLATLDPANADFYRKRLDELKSRIDRELFGETLLRTLGPKGGDILSRRAANDELESWLTSKRLLSQLGGWMKKAQALRGKKIITYHKTYVYFAARFGLQIAGELEDKPGIPPPPQRRDAVVDMIQRERVRVILNDNFYSRDAAEYVASKTGAKVVVTYIDVGASEEVDTYEKLITNLIEQIATAE
jgi:zinc/manganese transport system substrate-binding protein